MFKCEDCGKTFDWPNKVAESRGEYWGIPCTEDVYYCPYCGSPYFDELTEENEDEKSN